MAGMMALPQTIEKLFLWTQTTRGLKKSSFEEANNAGVVSQQSAWVRYTHVRESLLVSHWCRHACITTNAKFHKILLCNLVAYLWLHALTKKMRPC